MSKCRNDIAKEPHSQDPPEVKSNYRAHPRLALKNLHVLKQIGEEITNLILISRVEISVLLGVLKSLRVDRQCGR
jgi:hypothetical protein